MDNEKILSELKSRLGKTSLSDLTIMAVADNFPKGEEAEPTDGFYESCVAALRKLQGQYDHDVADFVRKYKSEKDVKPQEKPEDNLKSGMDFEQVKRLYESLRDDYAKLSERIDSAESRTKHKEMIDQVRERMRESGCSDDYVLKNVLRNANIDEKKSVDEVVSEMLTIYDTELREARGAGAMPRQSALSGGGKVKTDQDRFFERKWGTADK